MDRYVTEAARYEKENRGLKARNQELEKSKVSKNVLFLSSSCGLASGASGFIHESACENMAATHTWSTLVYVFSRQRNTEAELETVQNEIDRLRRQKEPSESESHGAADQITMLRLEIKDLEMVG